MSVVADSISVVAGGVAILKEVSFTAERGAVVAIAGPNGAGKSTLLRALAGDLVPDAGVVAIGDHDLSGMATNERAAARAMLGQFERHDIPFSVREVVAMGRYARRNRSTAQRDAAAVDAAVRLLDLGDVADRSFATLSGGEQQRTHVARVLAQEATVLLLDEPTGSLDVGHQRLVMTALRGLAAEGRTVVVVLHDLNLAAAFADTLVILSRGDVVARGAPAAALDEGLLSAVYEYPIRVVAHPIHRGPFVVPVDSEHDRSG